MSANILDPMPEGIGTVGLLGKVPKIPHPGPPPSGREGVGSSQGAQNAPSRSTMFLPPRRGRAGVGSKHPHHHHRRHPDPEKLAHQYPHSPLPYKPTYTHRRYQNWPKGEKDAFRAKGPPKGATTAAIGHHIEQRVGEGAEYEPDTRFVTDGVFGTYKFEQAIHERAKCNSKNNGMCPAPMPPLALVRNTVAEGQHVNIRGKSAKSRQQQGSAPCLFRKKAVAQGCGSRYMSEYGCHGCKRTATSAETQPDPR
jgi:hypothetical protein